MCVPLVALSLARPSAQAGGRLQVYKDPTCGCCALWVKHMQSHGFTASVTDVEDMTAIKTKHQVPSSVRSCHTTLIDGYVVEGHVPAADVQRLLKERPEGRRDRRGGNAHWLPGDGGGGRKAAAVRCAVVRQRGTDPRVRLTPILNRRAGSFMNGW